MSLSCSCDDSYSFFYIPPSEFNLLETPRRKRCESCKELISINSECLIFKCYRETRDEIEDRIYGEEGEIPTANKYMCEGCGGLFFALHDLGFCISLGTDSMKDLVIDYNEN